MTPVIVSADPADQDRIWVLDLPVMPDQDLVEELTRVGDYLEDPERDQAGGVLLDRFRPRVARLIDGFLLLRHLEVRDALHVARVLVLLHEGLLSLELKLLDQRDPASSVSTTPSDVVSGSIS